MPPIFQRWLKFREDAAKKADTSLAKLRVKNMKIADAIMSRLAEKVVKHFDPDKLDENRVASQFKDTALMQERFLGAADTTVTVQGGDDEFAGWTFEEKRQYLLTGKIPAGRNLIAEHAREDADTE